MHRELTHWSPAANFSLLINSEQLHAKCKIAKIVCFSGVAETLDQSNYGNLHKLVTDTLEHIDTRFESLCNSLTEELEALSYGELPPYGGTDLLEAGARRL